jgi:hypothetical protein
MKTETIENIASALAGLAAAACFTVLYVALTAPVAETVQKLIS